MAEIALPVLGLGALYLLSNKESDKKEKIQIFKILIILCHKEKFNQLQ
jgi:hypothetical protein